MYNDNYEDAKRNVSGVGNAKIVALLWLQVVHNISWRSCCFVSKSITYHEVGIVLSANP